MSFLCITVLSSDALQNEPFFNKLTLELVQVLALIAILNFLQSLT